MNPEKAFNDPIVFYFYTFLISFSALLFPFFPPLPICRAEARKKKVSDFGSVMKFEIENRFLESATNSIKISSDEKPKKKTKTGKSLLINKTSFKSSPEKQIEKRQLV